MYRVADRCTTTTADRAIYTASVSYRAFYRAAAVPLDSVAAVKAATDS